MYLAAPLLVLVLGGHQQLDHTGVGVDELVGAHQPLQVRGKLFLDLQRAMRQATEADP